MEVSQETEGASKWPGREPISISLTEKSASLRQGLAAIDMFEEGRYDAAIILASAAEGVLPSTDETHLFPALSSAKDTDFNFYQNRLKHGKMPEGFCVDEFLAAVSIVRSISKFVAVYRETCVGFDDFMSRARRRGQIPPSLYSPESR